jgi:DNA-binding transcriptional MocR family regulator
VRRPEYADAWEMYPFNSGYFMCLRLKTVEAEALRSHLLETCGVGLIATDRQDIRIAFSSVDEPHIDELFARIHKGIKDLEARQG